MVQLFMIVVCFLIFSKLITSLWKLKANDAQQEYVIRGLALALCALGAFSAGSWLFQLLFTGEPDINYSMLGGLLIAAPMLLLLMDKRKIPYAPQALAPKFFIRQPAMKIQRTNVISGGFRDAAKRNEVD